MSATDTPDNGLNQEQDGDETVAKTHRRPSQPSQPSYRPDGTTVAGGYQSQTRKTRRPTVTQQEPPRDYSTSSGGLSNEPYQSLSLFSLPGERPFDDRRARRDGKFLIGEVIGEGGMGVVVVARDLEMGRLVALKMLKREYRERASYVSALRFEAQLMGQLEHPNIVPVYEIGQLTDLSWYYAMKLTGEITLRDVLRQLSRGNRFAEKNYSLKRLIQYLRGICMAVEYAHARGVIHRDLKPDNILIGEYGEVQIMDWGIARVLSKDGGPAYFAGRPETPGAIIGTPHYMSPEQAAGQTELVDERSDVFALGVILYQMLTRQRPFSYHAGDNDYSSLHNDKIVAPSKRAPRLNIPPELDTICLKALAYDRDARYLRARELWDDIEEFLEGRKEQERLAELAEAQLLVATASAERYYNINERLASIESKLSRKQSELSHLDPVNTKKAVWELELDKDHQQLVEARAFGEASTGYHQVLAHQPHHQTARIGLSELFFHQANTAANRGDAAGFILYSELGHNALQVDGQRPEIGKLSVRTYPPGAHIRLFELGTDGSQLAEQHAIELGQSPLLDVELKTGSFLVSAEMPGFRESRQAVFIKDGSDRSLLLNMVPWSASIPAVARGDELVALKEAFQACISKQQENSLMLQGAAGLGKTKLLNQFVEYIDSLPAAVFYDDVQLNHVTRYVPFYVIGEFLRHRAGIDKSDDPRRIHVKLRNLVKKSYERAGLYNDDWQLTARRIASLPTLCGQQVERDSSDLELSAKEYTYTVIQSLVELVSTMASVSPTVLAIRGGDYIDRLSRDALYLIAKQIRNRPVLTLFLCDQNPAQLRSHRTLALTPLSKDRVEHHIRVLLRDPASPEVFEFIWNKAKGNAFNVTELTRTLIEHQWLVKRNGRWYLDDLVLTGEAKNDTLLQLLARAMDQLSPNQLAVLTTGSVCGMSFWREYIEFILQRDVTADLAELASNGYITVKPQSQFTATHEYRYRHDGIRRVLYERLAPEIQQQQHASLAIWLAQRQHEHLADFALRASHLLRSGDQLAAGPLLDHLAKEAERWEPIDAPPWFDWPDNPRSGLIGVNDIKNND